MSVVDLTEKSPVKVIMSTQWNNPAEKFNEICEEESKINLNKSTPSVPLTLADLCTELICSSPESKDSEDFKIKFIDEKISQTNPDVQTDLKIKMLNDKINENFKKSPLNPDNFKKIKFIDIPVPKKPTCAQFLTKGPKKGTQCISVVAKNSNYCHAHNPDKVKSTTKHYDQDVYNHILKLEETQRNLITNLQEIENKLSIHMQEPKKTAEKPTPKIKLNKLRQNQAYKFITFKNPNIGIFLNKTREIHVKLPKGFIEKKDGLQSWLSFNKKEKKFEWASQK